MCAMQTMVYRKLHASDHGKLLINTSISLLLLYVIFVIAGLVTSIEPLCGLVSALFQYSMLVFFGCTVAETVFLYYQLVIVIGKPIEHFARKAALIVWCKCIRHYTQNGFSPYISSIQLFLS